MPVGTSLVMGQLSMNRHCSIACRSWGVFSGFCLNPLKLALWCIDLSTKLNRTWNMEGNSTTVSLSTTRKRTPPQGRFSKRATEVESWGDDQTSSLRALIWSYFILVYLICHGTNDVTSIGIVQRLHNLGMLFDERNSIWCHWFAQLNPMSTWRPAFRHSRYVPSGLRSSQSRSLLPFEPPSRVLLWAWRCYCTSSDHPVWLFIVIGDQQRSMEMSRVQTCPYVFFVVALQLLLISAEHMLKRLWQPVPYHTMYHAYVLLAYYETSGLILSWRQLVPGSVLQHLASSWTH